MFRNKDQEKFLPPVVLEVRVTFKNRNNQTKTPHFPTLRGYLNLNSLFFLDQNQIMETNLDSRSLSRNSSVWRLTLTSSSLNTNSKVPTI